MPPAIALGGLCCCFPAGEMPDDRTHVPDPRPAEGAPPPSSLSPTHAARAGVRGKSSWLCCCWAFPSPASSSTRPMLLSWEQPGTRVELLLRQLLAGSTDHTGAGERLALASGGGDERWVLWARRRGHHLDRTSGRIQDAQANEADTDAGNLGAAHTRHTPHGAGAHRLYPC